MSDPIDRRAALTTLGAVAGSLVALAASMDSHLVGFTAEGSRLEGGTLKVIPGGRAAG